MKYGIIHDMEKFFNVAGLDIPSEHDIYGYGTV